jgi:hypothetical protein
MRNKIMQLLSYNGSLVLYKEPDPTSTDSEGIVSSCEPLKNELKNNGANISDICNVKVVAICG